MDDKLPLVSIIIPAYNAQKYIAETIDSILNQSYPHFELIIVDDASTDNSREIIQSYHDARLKYIFLENNNGGPSIPLNIGIKMARSDYIALCDSDDIMLNGRLGESIKYLKLYPELGLIFMDCKKFNKNGDFSERHLDNYNEFRRNAKLVDKDFYIIEAQNAYSELLYGNYIQPSGVTIPKKILMDVGYHDESLKNGQDYDLWLKITSKYNIGYLDKIGFRYRIHSNSISARNKPNQINRIKVLEKQKKRKLNDKQLKLINKRISKQYLDLGYYYMQINDFLSARKSLFIA